MAACATRGKVNLCANGADLRNLDLSVPSRPCPAASHDPRRVSPINASACTAITSAYTFPEPRRSTFSACLSLYLQTAARVRFIVPLRLTARGPPVERGWWSRLARFCSTPVASLPRRRPCSRGASGKSAQGRGGLLSDFYVPAGGARRRARRDAGQGCFQVHIVCCDQFWRAGAARMHVGAKGPFGDSLRGAQCVL